MLGLGLGWVRLAWEGGGELLELGGGQQPQQEELAPGRYGEIWGDMRDVRTLP